ncbi:MAG: exodeoxyribonuclease III, partial [bacterium]|nr:exodeoxyribonuclease III [bacterium]
MGKLKLISWNVNGIRAIHKKGFLDWFADVSPDMLCIQETKARREQLPEELVEVAGYTAYFAEAEKKGYSGVALYLKPEPNEVTTGFGIGSFDSEGRTLVAEYDGFTLCNVYFPNGKMSPERLQYKMDFYEAFLKHIDERRADGENIIVCGDVNTAHKDIDLARPKQNGKTSGFLPEERAWIDELIDRGFVDTF